MPLGTSSFSTLHWGYLFMMYSVWNTYIRYFVSPCKSSQDLRFLAHLCLLPLPTLGTEFCPLPKLVYKLLDPTCCWETVSWFPVTQEVFTSTLPGPSICYSSKADYYIYLLNSHAHSTTKRTHSSSCPKLLNYRNWWIHLQEPLQYHSVSTSQRAGHARGLLCRWQSWTKPQLHSHFQK